MKIFFIIFLSFIGKSNGIVYLRNLNDRGPGAVSSGLECLEQVERLYFKSQSQQTPNVAIFHTKNLSAPSVEIEVKYLANLHQRISFGHDEQDEKNFQLKVLATNDANKKYEGIMDVTLTDFYVIVTDNTNTLTDTIISISKTKSFNQEARYLILFNNPDQRNEGRQIACQFLNMLFKEYRAVNAVMLYASESYLYDIYIGDPYGTNGRVCGTTDDETAVCGKMKIVSAGKCNKGNIENVKTTENWLDMEKVPEEMKEDCVFNFCARVQEPFINQGCKSGLEISIMKFLQAEMGFAINTTCSDLDRGERNATGHWSDLLGQVRKGKCDIIAGAFFPDHDTHDDFASTDFYLQDYYRLFIPKAQLAPRWKGLVGIYKPEIWYAALTIFLISWIFWFIVGLFSQESYQHRQFALISLNVLCVTLGISANNRPEYTTLRFFFSILALYALVLTTLYTSKLINVFTHPIDDYQIDSITELLETNLPIGGRLENKDWFDNDDEIDMEVFARYNYSPEFRPSPNTIREISEGKLALLISQYYVEQTEYSDKVFGMTEELFSNHLEMLFERGFPLIKRINKILGFFRDIGIMSKLFKDFNYNTNIFAPLKLSKKIETLRNQGEVTSTHIEELIEDQQKDVKDEDQDENPEIVLTPEHLQGPFSIWLLGLSISCVIFLLEIIFNIARIRKFCSILWTPISSAIDKIEKKFEVKKKKNEKIGMSRKSQAKEVRFTPKKRRVITFESDKRRKKKIEKKSKRLFSKSEGDQINRK